MTDQPSGQTIGSLATFDNAEVAMHFVDIVHIGNDHRVEDDLVEAVIAKLQAVGIAAHIVARVWSDDAQSMVPYGPFGEATHPVQEALDGFVLPATGTFEALCLERGQVIEASAEMYREVDPGPEYAAMCAKTVELGVTFGYMLPMIASEPIGALSIYGFEGQEIDAHSLELASRAARVLASGIEKCRLLSAAEAQAGELARATALLAASNRDLQDFAYVASHDLQEPLRKIQTFGDRLETKAYDRLTDDQRVYLQRMSDASGRMQTLINDLLRYSRAATRGGEPTPLALRDLIDQAFADAKTALERHNATLDIGDIDAVVLGDEGQFVEVLASLMRNSLRYARDGVEPRIGLQVDRRSSDLADPLRVTLVYNDNGIGFDPKHDAKIFEPFFRLHSHAEIEGSGIGLAVCRRILGRYDTTIEAHGRPGDGATFTIRFRSGADGVLDGSGGAPSATSGAPARD